MIRTHDFMICLNFKTLPFLCNNLTETGKISFRIWLISQSSVPMTSHFMRLSIRVCRERILTKVTFERSEFQMNCIHMSFEIDCTPNDFLSTNMTSPWLFNGHCHCIRGHNCDFGRKHHWNEWTKYYMIGTWQKISYEWKN